MNSESTDRILNSDSIWTGFGQFVKLIGCHNGNKEISGFGVGVFENFCSIAR